MTPANDWEIKKYLRLSLAVLLATLGLVGLAALGFDIPILRQIVGFIFLTFIPGILILRILKIHNVGIIESLLYSVGLSIAFIYFTGLFANFVLPLISISRPISLLPIAAILAVFTLILSAMAYKRDKEFPASARDCFVEFPRFARDKPRNDRGESRFLWLPYLLLLVLPLLAIFGARLVNLYQNNFLLLFFIIVICCVMAMVAFDRLPRNAYPLAIVMIAIGLLFHITLISSQLWGYDIHVEYYFQNLVIQNGYWDFTIPHNYNTSLSVLLLCPIYSLLLNMDTIWVFKVIYPLLFCLVPLALFHIFRGRIGAKRAFFSVFFFMAIFTFFTQMTQLARQQIAELFFALMILLLVERRLALNRRTTLAVIFVVSLIMSHYALGYICLAFLLVGWGIVALIRSHAGRRAWGCLTHKFGGLPQSLTSRGAFPHKIMAVIIGVYLVFSLGWYGGIAQGTALNTIKNIGQSQYSLLSTELPELTEPGSKFFEPTEREALVLTAVGLDFASVSGLQKGFRVFQYITELFIVVGFFRMIFKPKSFKFKVEYIALSIVAALILLACIVIPRFSSYLYVPRFYHLSLFLLAPLCILGGEGIWQVASRLFRSALPRLKVTKKLALATNANTGSLIYLRFLALAVLIPYFLFNSGFVYEVSGFDKPFCPALSGYRADMSVFNQREAEAAIWLSHNLPDSSLVYADAYAARLLWERLYEQVGEVPISGEIPRQAYIFLRTWNIDTAEVTVREYKGVQLTYSHVSLSNMPALEGRLKDSGVIYNNGGTKILAPMSQL